VVGPLSLPVLPDEGVRGQVAAEYDDCHPIVRQISRTFAKNQKFQCFFRENCHFIRKVYYQIL
jgi:hypothetical protein